jgi:hypothetical protein
MRVTLLISTNSASLINSDPGNPKLRAKATGSSQSCSFTAQRAPASVTLHYVPGKSSIYHLRTVVLRYIPSHHVRYEYVQVHYPLGYKSESGMAQSVVLLASISFALAVDFYELPRRSSL